MRKPFLTSLTSVSNILSVGLVLGHWVIHFHSLHVQLYMLCLPAHVSIPPTLGTDVFCFVFFFKKKKTRKIK